METFSVQNIVSGNGVAISLSGMFIVFCGLLIISISIALLPKLLAMLEKKTSAIETEDSVPASVTEKGETVTEALEETDAEDKDIASIIGLVLRLEQERHLQSGNQMITIVRDSSQPSLWSKTGKMRSMPSRRTNA